MINYHFIAKYSEKFVYYIIDTSSSQLTMSLYVNEEKVDEVKGMMGEFVLQHDDIKLTTVNKGLKSDNVLLINGQRVELEKVKLGKLKERLSAKGIFNDVNPSRKQKEANALDLSKLIVPLIIMCIGAFLYMNYGRSPKLWIKASSFIVLVLGCVSFFKVLSHRFPFMKHGKIVLGLGLVTTIGLSALLDQLNYGPGGISQLNGQLGGEESTRIEVVIEEIVRQGPIRYKSKQYPESFKHLYSIEIEGKIYTGYYSNPTEVYGIGDTIGVYYLNSDPRINKAEQDIMN